MAAFLLFLLLALAASNSEHGGAVAAAADPPAALTILTLRGSPENTSLAVQTNDLSLAGFTDKSLHWHAFPGHEHLIPTSNIRSKEEAVAVMNMLMDADFEQVLKAHAVPINLE